ncbi:uncharacterized protein LOC101208398 [Cucumis sativus]|uniref:Uncharacterized protein n=1 Tax=Cucumis sativus TaxID=3659 RepID=A0A0A0KUQ0_CUCSA|nr:uncharacterized protein LOC101208398 [Cucumis sativus]KGN51446.1 hypothetical protein Csa_008955 [Cucumis sativus]
MGLGILRSIIRPLTRISRSHPFSSPTAFPSAFTFSKPGFHLPSTGSVRTGDPWFPIANHFHSLTETRLPKRRPSYKPRRKRASLRPPGPYAWVPYTPGQPILPNQPNEGSVKRRNEKKRIRLHRAFIMSERKKRKAQVQEANKKKLVMRVERKMAAVARERAWAVRLAELQKLEEEKKKSME